MDSVPLDSSSAEVRERKSRQTSEETRIEPSLFHMRGAGRPAE